MMDISDVGVEDRELRSSCENIGDYLARILKVMLARCYTNLCYPA